MICGCICIMACIGPGVSGGAAAEVSACLGAERTGCGLGRSGLDSPLLSLDGSVMSVSGDPPADSMDAVDDENGQARSTTESEVGIDSAGDRVREPGPSFDRSFGFEAKGLV
jgi:hypothetical protein